MKKILIFLVLTILFIPLFSCKSKEQRFTNTIWTNDYPGMSPSLIVNFNSNNNDEKNIKFSYSLLKPYYNEFYDNTEFYRALFAISVIPFRIENNIVVLSENYDIVYQENLSDFLTNDKYNRDYSPYPYTNKSEISNETFTSIDSTAYPYKQVFINFVLIDEHQYPLKGISSSLSYRLAPKPAGAIITSFSYGFIFDKATKELKYTTMPTSRSLINEYLGYDN
jgi:hypothetical protein